MSMEERVRAFHAEVLKGRNSKTVSNMNKFRKFLHKNQDYQFTERERSKLLAIVEAYFSQLDRDNINTNLSNSVANKKPSTKTTDDEDTKPSSKLLLEDALKLPHNTFGTKQKKTMLKWYDEVISDQEGKESGQVIISTPEKKTRPKWMQDREDEEDYGDEGEGEDEE
eukprot:TRINITY_DN9298_c0_g1_i1.p1 TRINITY_DN9298_c0_g1~~TRINITY_DN9298_c0_g1_i1.p1  ORF type:complete len:168 (-),score=35.04 TRINITY_DN9298_c0_g1_i1:296-799(-)